ncbi:MAG: aminotransferase class I/II-fold pyridoxal phosphate-dependent enzyme [Spirochaetales bacterium]|nr:aminotransferase class I/II-fold pyridoxal phosphate-dependent enzyme [Spirochaetales bacterium]
MSELQMLMEEFRRIQALSLSLNIQRGQPGDDNFDVCNGIMDRLGEKDMVTPSGVAIRNYPGGPAGLKEARELFAPVIGVRPDACIVGNNSSLKMLSNLLMWAMIRGLKDYDKPWGQKPCKIIVCVPGYDRHFTLLEALGIEMLQVHMQGNGPDVDTIEQLAASDPAIKGFLFVPTYSNPTGEITSEQKISRLATMETAAADFTIFADEAYIVHHLTEKTECAANLIDACAKAGNPDRAWLFASTSKITFSGAGIGFMGSSKANVDFLLGLIGTQTIGPDKVNQYRHYRFISAYPGGIAGIMKKHAGLLGPKFAAVQRVLAEKLGGSGLADWTNPAGGYFVSLNTAKPVAARVVELMNNAGVSLTPAGATYPYGKDPENRNIRIAPTRPPLKELEQAMEILCLCIRIASLEQE